MPAKIEVFTTSILSNPKIRSNHEAVARIMNSFPHTTYDVASSEEHKLYWKRKNGNNPELPMIMVNGSRAGSVEELQEAAEFGELRQFLKLDEKEEDVTDILDVPDLTPDQADQLLKDLDSADKSTAS